MISPPPPQHLIIQHLAVMTNRYSLETRKTHKLLYLILFKREDKLTSHSLKILLLSTNQNKLEFHYFQTTLLEIILFTQKSNRID